jgi:hypothetical protein
MPTIKPSFKVVATVTLHPNSYGVGLCL